MSTVELPKDKTLAAKKIEAEANLALRKSEMGKLGEFFGTRDNAAVYFAATLIFVALGLGTVLAVYEPTLRADALKGILGLAATALGFMIGTGLKARD